MTATAAQRAELVTAARVLSGLGLVTAFGHVSARAGNVMLITPAADLAVVTEPDLVEVPLTAGQPPADQKPAGQKPAGQKPGGAGEAPAVPALPPGAPAEAWIHLALYRARPDAQAIARAQPPGAFAAAAVSTELLPLHGQAAWLGDRVPVHDSAQLLRSPAHAARAAARLPSGEALLLRGNGAITLGADPGLAVARMWLLAAACDTWLAAQQAGQVTPLTAAEVTSWQAAAAGLLPRLWQHLLRRCAPGIGPVPGHGPAGKGE